MLCVVICNNKRFGHAIGYTVILVTLPRQCNWSLTINAMMIDVKRYLDIVANWLGGVSVFNLVNLPVIGGLLENLSEVALGASRFPPHLNFC